MDESSTSSNLNHVQQHKQIDNVVEIFKAVQSLTAVNPHEDNMEFLTTFLDGMFSTVESHGSSKCEIFIKIQQVYEAYKTLARFYPGRSSHLLMNNLSAVIYQKCDGQRNPDDALKQKCHSAIADTNREFKREVVRYETNDSTGTQPMDFNMDHQDNNDNNNDNKNDDDAASASVTTLEPEMEVMMSKEKNSNRSKLSSPQSGVNPSPVNTLNSTARKFEKLDTQQQDLTKTPKNWNTGANHLYRCSFCLKSFIVFAGKEHHEKRCIRRPTASSGSARDAERRAQFRRLIPLAIPQTSSSLPSRPTMFSPFSNSTGFGNSSSSHIQKVQNWLLSQPNLKQDNHNEPELENDNEGQDEILKIYDNNTKGETTEGGKGGEASLSKSIEKPLPKVDKIPAQKTVIVKAQRKVKSPAVASRTSSKIKSQKRGKQMQTKKESSPTGKSDEDAHTCDFCHKKFSHRQNLIIHVRIHTGEKPYACQFCDRKFAASGNCKTHENSKQHDDDRANLIFENRRKAIILANAEKQAGISKTTQSSSTESAPSSSSLALSPLYPAQKEDTENSGVNPEAMTVNKEAPQNPTDSSKTYSNSNNFLVQKKKPRSLGVRNSQRIKILDAIKVKAIEPPPTRINRVRIQAVDLLAKTESSRGKNEDLRLNDRNKLLFMLGIGLIPKENKNKSHIVKGSGILQHQKGLNQGPFLVVKKLPENLDKLRLADKVDNVDEIGSPNTSTQSTESLPSPVSTLPSTIELGPKKQNMITVDDGEEDGNNNNSKANYSDDTETMDPEPSPGLIKIPAKVIKMVKNSRASTTMHSEVLLDGLNNPMTLVETPDDHNGIRYTWFVTAEQVARKIYRKNKTTRVDLVDINKNSIDNNNNVDDDVMIL